MIYNKLVRDRIPEIIKNKGEKAIYHTASEAEYKEKLIEKLSEETQEYIRSEDVSELADILEVIYSLASLSKVSSETLEKIRIDKAQKRGSFKEKIILEETL